MFAARQSRLAIVLCVACSVATCSRKTPTAPEPPPETRAAVSIASMSVAGERAAAPAGGFIYRVVLHLRETAGAPATVTSVHLRFVKEADVLVSAQHDQPIPASANVCPASGAVDTREFVTSDSDASHPYAAAVQATVTYSDGTASTATAAATASVPPLQEPPPPQTYSLTGVITDADTHRPMPGARVEVLNGPNAGNATTTDANGAYVLQGLSSGTFRVRASADDYAWGEQNVTVPEVPRADFELRKSAPAACIYVLSSASASIGFAAGDLTVSITRTSGTCAWSAVSDVNWITVIPSSGSGSGSITLRYESNTSFVGRLGTVRFEWAGGIAEIGIGQQPEPAFCRIVTIDVDGQNPLAVPATGGTYTARVAPEPGTLQGLCGPWTASASDGVTITSLTSGPQVPTVVKFTVAPNSSTSPRTLWVTVVVNYSKSLTLTINQAGS